MYRIEVANQQSRHPLDATRLRRAVELVLVGESVGEATVGVAVVDDSRIERLNREYLDHDGPTDVLSFLLEQEPGRLEGEIVVSADTAAEAAQRYGWTTGDELLLYAVHGTLHLCGYDDLNPADKAVMRGKERAYLSQFGLTPPYDEAST